MVAMNPLRWRFPMALRMALGLLPLFPMAALLQWFVAREGLHLGLDREQLALLAAPWLLPALAVPLVVTWVTRMRLVGINAALRAIGQGRLHTRLPEPPSREFEEMAETFTNMALALERAMAQLREVDQGRRRLFADLAHELATPAGAVLGLADTLCEPGLCPPGPEGEALRGRLLRALAGEAQRLGGLTRDLAELAHLEDPQVPLRPVPADVAQIAGRVVERMNAGEGAPIELVAGARGPGAMALLALCDPERVEQVLVNLLHNARRYSPPGARIDLHVVAAGDQVELAVRDRGPGVPAELLPHLGERLWRQDPSRDRRTGGHGLGLAIVRQIVNRHGGQISFSNADGGGLLVRIWLPGAALG